MMGKTHLAVGVASALLVTHPQTMTECVVSVLGGAIGGTLCDVDLFDQDNRHALRGQLLAVALLAVAFFLDRILHTGVFFRMLNPNRVLASMGGIGFMVLWLLAVKSSHRSFSHSILALMLFTAAVHTAMPPVTLGFFVAFVSHLVLDLLNKKGIRLLYPLRKGISFGLCYADGWLNKILLRLGTLLSVILLFYGMVLHGG